MEVRIQFDATRAVQLLEQYPKKVERATVRALNRALTSGRATVARLVAADMGMKVGDVKEKLREEKATGSRLVIRLRASLKRVPLYDLKGRGRKIPGSFIATMPGGHVGVFKRQPGATRRGPAPNRSQLPIVELYGPSIGRVFIKHQAAGIAQMREAFEKNLESELKFAGTEG